MSISDVFSAVLLDHYRHPRQYGKLDSPDLEMDGANPLCGDEIHIQVNVDDAHLKEIAFTGKACAICTASTSMFCELAPEKSFSEIEELRELVISMLHGDELSRENRRKLGDIYALEGVSKLPVRVKCALLVWETWALIKKQLEDTE